MKKLNRLHYTHSPEPGGADYIGWDGGDTDVVEAVLVCQETDRAGMFGGHSAAGDDHLESFAFECGYLRVLILSSELSELLLSIRDRR